MRTKWRLESPSLRAVSVMKRPCTGARSTEVTEAAPRDRSSKEMAPVPAKRSSARIPSMSIMFSMTLKMFSRAKSVVGRAVIDDGTSNRRRPYLPLIILIVWILGLMKGGPRLQQSRLARARQEG